MLLRQDRLLLASGFLLVLAALIGPKVVPLYDGVGFPDEPYRYASHPGNKPPTSADKKVPSDSLKDDLYLTSQESGPQVAIILYMNTVTWPTSGSLEVKATPQAPTEQPSGGQIAGNVYLVSATSDPGPPRFNNSNAFVSLRFPTEIPVKNPPVMVYRSGSGKWQELKTDQTGADIYQAGFQGLGQYALVNVASPAQAATASKKAQSWPWIAVILAIALISLVVAIRFTPSRKRRDRGKTGGHAR